MAKKETTLRCVTVLTVIAVICGVLLAVLNPLLYVPPTVDDLANNFTAEGEWSIEELNADFEKGNGGKVLLAGKLTNAEGVVTHYGLTIKTNSDAQLGECTYALYFDAQTDTLVEAKYIVDGTTGGKTYAAYGDKGANFEDYLVQITSENVFDSYTYPQTGATKTLKAVNNALIMGARYYYNVYVAGGNE